MFGVAQLNNIASTVFGYCRLVSNQCAVHAGIVGVPQTLECSMLRLEGCLGHGGFLCIARENVFAFEGISMRRLEWVYWALGGSSQILVGNIICQGGTRRIRECDL